MKMEQRFTFALDAETGELPSLSVAERKARSLVAELDRDRVPKSRRLIPLTLSHAAGAAVARDAKMRAITNRLDYRRSLEATAMSFPSLYALSLYPRCNDGDATAVADAEAIPS